ncbi:MAG: [citrate (pro-3S)-lyase] ligase [Prevotellaceae bacterium]|jgi:[citrate (pro-3S)-lyase] ligase|nr:[citrate (pro-3S)-lyase] ligase [Prevotellaceae bacterium]
MFENVEIRELLLSVKMIRKKVERFLQENGLALDEMDYYAGIFSENEMLAGGGFYGNVMKCIAVASAARESNLTNKLVSHLRSIGQKRGFKNIFVFTKPENESIFKSLAFNIVGRAAKAIILESNPYGISDYCNTLSQSRRKGVNGCIVMNCNPMTLGHRYLVEEAVKMVDTLHIILVEEDRSEFSYCDRLQMVKAGVADLKNVMVHEGGKYVISSATFPNYFIKEVSDISQTQMELDLDIFTSCIAPALGVSIRFAGTEKNDKLTGRYNEMMKSILPAKEIEFREIKRLQHDGKDISATSIRAYIKTFQLQKALALAPQTTQPFIVAQCAKALSATAANALYEELKTTPKPGLVDLDDNGAHGDMTYDLMRTSIGAISPYFEQLAKTGMEYAGKPVEDVFLKIREIGINAEKAMLAATGGVNTHRGTIFAMGLCVVAVALLLASGEALTLEKISEMISTIAVHFERQTDSNGGKAYQKYNIKGALDNARDGYNLLTTVLPSYMEILKNGEDRNNANLRILLLIISLLDDSNVYHRKGAEIATEVKTSAFELYRNYNIEKVRDLNMYFIQNNISPGGSADMLSVIIFLENILNNKTLHKIKNND